MSDKSIPCQRAINCGKAVAEHLLQAVAHNLGPEMAAGCFTGTGLYSLGRIVEKSYPPEALQQPAGPVSLTSSGLSEQTEEESAPVTTSIPESAAPAPAVLMLIQAIKRRIAEAPPRRVGQLAEELTATKEMIEEAINARCSGLIIKAGGWVKLAGPDEK